VPAPPLLGGVQASKRVPLFDELIQLVGMQLLGKTQSLPLRSVARVGSGEHAILLLLQATIANGLRHSGSPEIG